MSDGRRWLPHARSILRGDVLRVRVKRGSPWGRALGLTEDAYCYAVASGGGFGCHTYTNGNAIFVHDETRDLDAAIRLRDTDDTMPELARSARWEKYWNVEILDLPPLAPEPE